MYTYSVFTVFAVPEKPSGQYSLILHLHLNMYTTCQAAWIFNIFNHCTSMLLFRGLKT